MRKSALLTVQRGASLTSIAFAIAMACSLTLGAVYPTGPVDEEFGQPNRAQRQVGLLVSRLMEKDHLSRRSLDDSISRRAFGMYLQALDPTKIYFMKSDLDQFQQFRDQLDDYLQDGNFEPAFEIYKRFLERLDQRLETAVRLCDEQFDYAVEEEIVTDRDLIDYAATEEDAMDRWRKRIKYNLLVMANEEGADGTPADRLKRRYESFARRMHQADNGDIIEMFITSITSSFDPHTTYMSTETFDNFMIQMRLQLEGIGATLQASEDDGYTVIKRIVPGGAADKQGILKVEDKIVAVGQGKNGEMIDVTGMKLDDVVSQIRGKKGTVVRLAILSGGAEIKTIEIVREEIKLEDSAARGQIFEEGKKADGSPYQVGLINLPSFYSDLENAGRVSSQFRSTTRDVDQILTNFREKNVDVVILDLRMNGGGSLREAIDCTGLFIDRGPVVQVKDAYGHIQKYDDDAPGMSWDGPLVVLTSKFSASASEILAGAVQDYGRGIIVGDSTTHGKGTVQSLMNLNQIVYGTENPPSLFGALKITMQQFYRPNGDSTQKRGVLADIVLPSVTDKMDVSESDLEYPVEFDKIRSATFQRMRLVNSDLLEKLRAASLQRINQDEQFLNDKERIEAYVEQKELKSVSLNRDVYLARRAKFDAEKEDKNVIEEQLNQSNLEIKRTPYLDEVMRIAVDYTQALKSDKVAQKE